MSFAGVSALADGGSHTTMDIIGLLLLLAACGKSAQVPLQSWLLDAMEGPTPVSALIHAATMVTAGVFMVARLSPLFETSSTAMTACIRSMVARCAGVVTSSMSPPWETVSTSVRRSSRLGSRRSREGSTETSSEPSRSFIRPAR